MYNFSSYENILYIQTNKKMKDSDVKLMKWSENGIMYKPK